MKQHQKDTFELSVSSEEKKIVVETWKQGGQSILSTTVFKELIEHKLTPSENANDFLHFGLGLYTADQIVSREIHGFQGWSRHFRLYTAVTHLNEWKQVRLQLEKLLSFLSGDKWEIFLRQKESTGAVVAIAPNNRNPQNITTVSLFSGGMDSFIGAVNLLESKSKVAFVSHYKKGVEGNVQSKLYNQLETQYGKGSFVAHQFYVQPNQSDQNVSKEGTSRARSFLFLCLGITVANCLGDDVVFIVPENGLISLNVPLTGTRLSSHSTRTTHPYYMSVFREVIEGLNIKNSIINPYQYKTKGEMILECKNLAVFKKMNAETVSCSHSEHSRYAGLRPGVQCGYCVPCLIRRAAEKKANIKGTEYVHYIENAIPTATSKSGSDIRAFKLALKRMENKRDFSIMFDILSSGPLPFLDENELQQYISIYKRGMNEVSTLLK